MSSIYKPFTYHIYCIPTGEHYYGVRWEQNCYPDQLWTTYFTSSKLVKDRIKTYGKQSFLVTIRKTFSSAEDAVKWESKVLRRIDAKNRTNWLNQHNNSPEFRCKGHTKESNLKNRLAHLGKKRKPFTDIQKRNMSQALKNITKTTEHKQKIAESCKGRIFSEDHKRNMAIAQRKRYTNISSRDLT